MAPRKYNTYINHGEYCELLAKGGSFLIDTEDLDRVLGFGCWNIRIPKPGRGKRDQINVGCGKYNPNTTPKIKSTSLSRFIMNVFESDVKVDHRDHNRLDNRKSNLRRSTDAQNQGNRGLRIDNSTGYKGISFKKSNGRFQAQFTYTVNGKRHTKYLGLYSDPAEGAKAYDAYAISYFGEEFARPNFKQNSSNVSV